MIGLKPKSTLKNVECVHNSATDLGFPRIAFPIILTVRKYVCNSMLMFSKYVCVYIIAVFGEHEKE